MRGYRLEPLIYIETDSYMLLTHVEGARKIHTMWYESQACYGNE